MLGRSLVGGIVGRHCCSAKVDGLSEGSVESQKGEMKRSRGGGKAGREPWDWKVRETGRRSMDLGQSQ